MSDTIDRQAAIATAVSAAINWHKLANPQYSIAYCIGEAMRQLPSAQPDTYWKEQCQSYEQTINKLRESLSAKSESFEWCTDCKEYDQEKHCCPRWNKVIKKTIDEMKPEIVHCGECRHYVFVDDRMDMFPIRGCSVTGFRDVDAGDFCSRAERREDG